jgi:hypothetical protein
MTSISMMEIKTGYVIYGWRCCTEASTMWRPCLAESSDHVGENVLNLVSQRQQDHNDDDGDEHQDEGVLNHSLTALRSRPVTQR